MAFGALPIIPGEFEYKGYDTEEWEIKKVMDFFEKSRMIVWSTDSRSRM